MRPVARDEILDYVTYGERRDEIRAGIMKQKQNRRIHLGDHLTFLFENRDTVRYQIQEMLRVEQIVKESDIVREMETYNELLGGPGELGCSLLIEIADPAEREILLEQWRDLPEHIYVKLENGDKIYARFDPRQVGETRLAAVQYLIFDTEGRVPVALATDLPGLQGEVKLAAAQREALGLDLKD